MELAVLGAGAYLATALFAEKPVVVAPTQEQLMQSMLEDPAALFMHEYRERGAIAPSGSSVAMRLPWDKVRPPYYIAETATGGPNNHPTERVYKCLVNASEHERHDIAQEFYSARPHYARKRGQALWTAFTREISVPDEDGGTRSTQRQGFQWMPPNPTDSDWNEAALLAKALPGDPTLFTPDSTFMTAPGVTWRYGGVQTH
jgi:hypothetical protein